MLYRELRAMVEKQARSTGIEAGDCELWIQANSFSPDGFATGVDIQPVETVVVYAPGFVGPRVVFQGPAEVLPRVSS